jgi:hypothetical protein
MRYRLVRKKPLRVLPRAGLGTIVLIKRFLDAEHGGDPVAYAAFLREVVHEAAARLETARSAAERQGWTWDD